MMKLGLFIFGLLALALLILFSGKGHWRNRTQALQMQLESGRISSATQTYDTAELPNLPAPVQRYFRKALQPKQKMINAARIRHTGDFNTSETTPKWSSFESAQRIVMQRPGFVWAAHIRLAPAVKVYVHDAYVLGEGWLTAKLFGWFTVAKVANTPEAAAGELMRFLAEAAWYPTKLLPSQGVTWEAISDSVAMATLIDGKTKVSLNFSFGADSLIAKVRSEARARLVNGVAEMTPWEGNFWEPIHKEGMWIPQQGEVAWVLPTGRLPYWRGKIKEIQFQWSK